MGDGCQVRKCIKSTVLYTGEFIGDLIVVVMIRLCLQGVVQPGRKDEAPQHHCTSANRYRTYYGLNPSELWRLCARSLEHINRSTQMDQGLKCTGVLSGGDSSVREWV